MKRLNIIVSDDQHYELRCLAATARLTIRAAVQEAIRQWCQQQQALP